MHSNRKIPQYATWKIESLSYCKITVNCQQTTNESKHLKKQIIGKAITNVLAIEEAQKAMPDETQCFPGWANNSKYNKNIININGIFIFGLIIYFHLGLAISLRFGVITTSKGQLYCFVFACCVSIFLPAIYFVRNPKHLKSVLQDHNFMPNNRTPQQ